MTELVDIFFWFLLIDWILYALIPVEFRKEYGWKRILIGYGIKMFLEYIFRKK